MTNYYLNNLIEELLKIKDKKILRNFLEGLLTPQELEEIPTRVQIVKMLKKGIPQHEIAQKLRIGVATVTRGSNEIKKGKFININ
jgi:TrpR family transcriptional regulator, trp operon repressor